MFENLSGWKAKGGKSECIICCRTANVRHTQDKGTAKRQDFYLWCHCQIITLVEDKWLELGDKVVKVNPRYTSKFAYDASSLV